MIDEPQIVVSKAVETAVIRLTVPRAEIRAVMHAAIVEVMAAVTAQGIGPAGPLLTYHLRMDPGVFDLEVGFPVRAAVTPVGRVIASRLESKRIARTVYHGGYEGLAAAWGAFGAWMKATGHTPGQDLWESYVQGPESGADESTWRTELNRPVV